MYVDSHCHLNRLDGPAGAIARARAAGVSGMLTVCTHIGREAADLLALARAEPDVWCTVGTHPHEATESATLDTLMTHACADPRVIGIGETGLDYYYDNAPRDAQEASFRRHIQASVKTGLPLIVHTRDAEADTMRIMEDERAERAVMHCFSGSRALADWAVARGFYISFSGIVTFQKADELRAIARDVPAECLLIETDAPYLAPVPYRGKANEPAYVTHTAERLTEIRGVSVREIARMTRENFSRLFNPH